MNKPSAAMPQSCGILPVAYTFGPLHPLVGHAPAPDVADEILALGNGSSPPLQCRVHIVPPRQLLEIVRSEADRNHAATAIHAALTMLGEEHDVALEPFGEEHRRERGKVLGLSIGGITLGLLRLPEVEDDCTIDSRWQSDLLRLLEAAPGATLCADLRYLSWPLARQLLGLLAALVGRLPLIVITYPSTCVDCAVALTNTSYPVAEVEGWRMIRLPEGRMTVVTSLEVAASKYGLFDQVLEWSARRLAALRAPARGHRRALMRERNAEGRRALRVYPDFGPYGSNLLPLLGGPRRRHIVSLSGAGGGGFNVTAQDPWCVGYRGSVAVRVQSDGRLQLLALGLRFPENRLPGLRLSVSIGALLSADVQQFELEVSDDRSEWILVLRLPRLGLLDVLDLRFAVTQVRRPGTADAGDCRELGLMVDIMDIWPESLSILAHAMQHATAAHPVLATRSLPADAAPPQPERTSLPANVGFAIICDRISSTPVAVVGDACWLPLERIEAGELLHLVPLPSEPRRLQRMLAHASHSMGINPDELVALTSPTDPLPEVCTAETERLSPDVSVTYVGFHGLEDGSFRWSQRLVCYIVMRSQAALDGAVQRWSLPIVNVPDGARSAPVRVRLRNATAETFSSLGHSEPQRLLDDTARPLRQGYSLLVPSGGVTTVRIVAPPVNLAELGLGSDERRLGLRCGRPVLDLRGEAVDAGADEEVAP